MNTFLQIVVFLMSLIGIYFLLIIAKEDGIIIIKFIVHIINELFKFFYKKRKDTPEELVNPKQTKLLIFIQNHRRPLIFFCIFCLLILFLNQYRHGSTSFIELFGWIFFFIFTSIFALLPQEWIECLKDTLKSKFQNIATSTDHKSEPLSHRKIDFNLIDAPLEDSNDDQFHRTNFTLGITQTITNKKDSSSFVIGIYGEWGEGKTSILNFIAKELEKNPEIICIRYNPWRYNDETQLLQNFFFTLADSLGRSLSNNKERIGEWLSKYATILTPLSIGIGGIVELSPGEIFSNVGKAFSSVELNVECHN